MTPRDLMIHALLRLYPPAWRREFGAEFAELLRAEPLRLSVLANVASSGVNERVIHLVRRLTGGAEMTSATFAVRYDRMTKIVSAAAIALVVALPLLLLSAGTIATILAASLSVAVIGLSYAYSPRGYEISGGAFRVKRLIGDIVVPLDRLRFVRDATAADFWGCVRLWGSGGLFGYYGKYWSKALGRSTWYVTDRNKAVVVTDGERTMLVSPEDRDQFVAAITPAGTAAPLADTSAPRTGMMLSAGIGLAIGGVTLAVVAAALLYAPGRPPVDLTRESLVIHSRFYGMTVPAASVDVANVRVVDLGSEPGWKPALRTGGFGNPYYRAGNFRTANGRSVKLFTTGAEKLVLLPPARENGTPVLLDVAEPERFAASVRKAWSGR
ncbi:MAG: PH domain-containing protein [Bryobacteraceae bacterium]